MKASNRKLRRCQGGDYAMTWKIMPCPSKVELMEDMMTSCRIPIGAKSAAGLRSFGPVG